MEQANEMLRLLIKDRSKREEEITNERECREHDFQVQWEKREKERLARE